MAKLKKIIKKFNLSKFDIILIIIPIAIVIIFLAAIIDYYTFKILNFNNPGIMYPLLFISFLMTFFGFINFIDTFKTKKQVAVLGFALNLIVLITLSVFLNDAYIK